MIGVYDSGLGGLSVWREIIKLLPEEDYLYFADSRYCPYGTRDHDFLCSRATQVTGFLADRGAEMVVVACNTATAAAIEHLRSTFSIPFVGMEPAIKPAILNTRSGVVGVLATAVTFSGELYHRTLEHYAQVSEGIKVIEQVGYGLVEAVESGAIHTPETVALLESYIVPMLEAGADHIVLGCTHYPFLSEEIEKIARGRAAIVNPAPAVARQVQRIYGGSVKEHSPRQFFSSAEFNPAAVTLIDSLCGGREYCLHNNFL